MNQEKRKITLKELRARVNKTQAEMAKLFDISTPTYNAWEARLSNVSIGKVKKIVDYFEIKLDDIDLDPYA